MQKTVLSTVDGSARGFEALSILGRFLKDQPEIQLCLFYSVQQPTGLPAVELDLPVFQRYRISSEDQNKIGNAIFEEARKRLVAAGFPEVRILSKLKLDGADPAQEIIAEADAAGIRTIALGRRGRNQLQTLLLGSVSGTVAQYGHRHTIWIIDTPTRESSKILIAMEDAADSQELSEYAADLLAPIPGLEFVLLHLMPPVPPTFLDDGHILEAAERKDRQIHIGKWRESWMQKVDEFMEEACRVLTARGANPDRIKRLVLTTRVGIARDLLEEIDRHDYRMVIMGKKSLHKRKPFLMGSHAHKILQTMKGAVLCLVDSRGRSSSPMK